MSIPVQIPSNTSTATAGATVFPYDFKILAATDLLVKVNGSTKTLDVDYTVDGVGNESGGNVTFLASMAGGEKVMRRRNMPIARETDFQGLGDLRSVTLNSDLDAAIMLIQQLFQNMPDLPDPEALKPLVWNAEADALENGSTELTGDMLLRPNLASTAPGYGSSLVSFLQSGTGAVARTAQDKAREVVSAEDFGALGDGATDDATNLQKAFSSGAKRVRLTPGKNYRVGTKLTASGITIEGRGATISTATHIVALECNGDDTHVDGVNFVGPTDGTYTANSRAIHFTGTRNTGLAPTYINRVSARDCKVSGFGDYGIFFSYAKDCVAEGNTVSDVGYGGICGISCEDVRVVGNHIRDISQGSPGGDSYGIFFDRNESGNETECPRSYRVVIASNIIRNIYAASGTNGQAIDTHGGVDFVIDGNVIEDVGKGIFVTSSVLGGVAQLAPQNVAVSNNSIRMGATGVAIIVAGAFNGAFVEEYAEGCVISGNTIEGGGTAGVSTSGAMTIQLTRSCVVQGNTIKRASPNALYLNLENREINVHGNVFFDPNDDTYAAPSCILIAGNNITGYIGNNTFSYGGSPVGTYKAVNSIRISSGLTGLDLRLAESQFIGIDASHLSLVELTTTGVNHAGLYREAGEIDLTLTSGGSTSLSEVTFSKRFPYVPTVIVSPQSPVDVGGKGPIVYSGERGTSALSATKVTVYAKPYDLGTWSASGTLTVGWEAR